MEADYILEKIEPKLYVDGNEVNIKPIVTYEEESIFFTYCIDGVLGYLRKQKIFSSERLNNILEKNKKNILDIIDRYINIDIECFTVLGSHIVLENYDKEMFFKNNIRNLICNTNLVDDYSFMPILDILENIYLRQLKYGEEYDSNEIKMIVGAFIRKQIPIHVLEQIYYNDKIHDMQIKKKLINLYYKLDECYKVNITDYVNMCENRSFEEVKFILNRTISLLKGGK